MTTYAESFKREVSRMAKKEIRAEVASLRKATTGHRSEIAALKKTVKSLEATVKQLVRLANRAGERSADPAAKDIAPQTTATPSGQARSAFDAAGFAQRRTQLELTQAQWAKVLGVSTLSVYKWEKGRAQPRAKQLDAIRTGMLLGKRRALAIANS